ncbi:MAG TPA: MlaD family protein [Methylomirabilota bacterium]|nr:MlaD family protein [Methylomirabilota bacterium]
MTDPASESAPPEREPEAPLPSATVRRRRWRFPLVWIVPLVAAIVAGSLVYNRLQEFGPTITIKFRDASGVKPDQTEIRYRGVPVGKVTTIELTPDHEYVVVTGRLRHSAAGLAKEGALFWIVRPEVGFGTVRGLSTVLTGSYIQVLPGSGKDRKCFVGLESASPTMGKAGLDITLAASQLGSVRLGAPVFYRGIEVGSVTATELSRDASAAHVKVFIAQRYARLVRVGSRFWLVSGIDVDFGLFRGLSINVESLRSLVTGGIAFASPEDAGSPPAREGTLFLLHDKPQKEWLEWSPKIQIGSAG